MPYRRLPNTDQARLRAIKKALEMAMKKPVDELAFSQVSLSRVRAFILSFEQAVVQHKTALKNQSAKSKAHNEMLKKARLYISHFIQVLNFAIIRGELNPKVREYYGLSIDDKNVPLLNLESEVVEWGKKVIDGEQDRIRNGGGSPIYSPSVAVVKVRYEEFVEAHHHQKMLQNITHRASEKVGEMREEADELILRIWNEIEEHFINLPEERKRKEAQEYGVIYFFRPKEKKKIEAMKLQQNFDFEGQ